MSTITAIGSGIHTYELPGTGYARFVDNYDRDCFKFYSLGTSRRESVVSEAHNMERAIGAMYGDDVYDYSAIDAAWNHGRNLATATIRPVRTNHT